MGIVVFEGGEGAGKTSTMDKVEATLRDQLVSDVGPKVERFKFPSPFVRETFLSLPWNFAQSQSIMFADLAYHYDKIVQAGREGIALVDRSWASDGVYRAVEIMKFAKMMLAPHQELLGKGYRFGTRTWGQAPLDMVKGMGPLIDELSEKIDFENAFKYALGLIARIFPCYLEGTTYFFFDVDPETGASREDNPARFSDPEHVKAINTCYRHLFWGNRVMLGWTDPDNKGRIKRPDVHMIWTGDPLKFPDAKTSGDVEMRAQAKPWYHRSDSPGMSVDLVLRLLKEPSHAAGSPTEREGQSSAGESPSKNGGDTQSS